MNYEFYSKEMRNEGETNGWRMLTIPLLLNQAPATFTFHYEGDTNGWGRLHSPSFKSASRHFQLCLFYRL